MYDGRQQGYIHGQQQQRPPQRPPQAPPPQQWQQQQQQLLQAQQQASQQRQRPRGVSFPEGMPAIAWRIHSSCRHILAKLAPMPPTSLVGGPPPTGPPEEAEYPLSGSVASCDACGEVVNRYYHCQGTAGGDRVVRSLREMLRSNIPAGWPENCPPDSQLWRARDAACCASALTTVSCTQGFARGGRMRSMRQHADIHIRCESLDHMVVTEVWLGRPRDPIFSTSRRSDLPSVPCN